MEESSDLNRVLQRVKEEQLAWESELRMRRERLKAKTPSPRPSPIQILTQGDHRNAVEGSGSVGLATSWSHLLPDPSVSVTPTPELSREAVPLRRRRQGLFNGRQLPSELTGTEVGAAATRVSPPRAIQVPATVALEREQRLVMQEQARLRQARRAKSRRDTESREARELEMALKELEEEQERKEASRCRELESSRESLRQQEEGLLLAAEREESKPQPPPRRLRRRVLSNALEAPATTTMRLPPDPELRGDGIEGLPVLARERDGTGLWRVLKGSAAASRAGSCLGGHGEVGPEGYMALHALGELLHSEPGSQADPEEEAPNRGMDEGQVFNQGGNDDEALKRIVLVQAPSPPAGASSLVPSTRALEARCAAADRLREKEDEPAAIEQGATLTNQLMNDQSTKAARVGCTTTHCHRHHELIEAECESALEPPQKEDSEEVIAMSWVAEPAPEAEVREVPPIPAPQTSSSLVLRASAMMWKERSNREEKLKEPPEPENDQVHFCPRPSRQEPV